LKILSYSGAIVHHRFVAGIQAPKIVNPTRALRAPAPVRSRARLRAHVAANFDNFGRRDGD
jgi:hypothetical protein